MRRATHLALTAAAHRPRTHGRPTGTTASSLPTTSSVGWTCTRWTTLHSMALRTWIATSRKPRPSSTDKSDDLRAAEMAKVLRVRTGGARQAPRAPPAKRLRFVFPTS